MGRVPPRRIGLDIRKRLIRKRLDPPNAAARVKHDPFTRFGAARSTFHEIHLNWTSRTFSGDSRELDGWFGKKAPRMTTGKQNAPDYERDNRSLLLEQAIVRGGDHSPPCIGDIKQLVRPISREQRLHNLPAIAPALRIA
jgi:hypothetical protein